VSNRKTRNPSYAQDANLHGGNHEEQNFFNRDQEQERKPSFSIQNITDLPDEMPPMVIEGLLRNYEIILIGGHSKSWKSWALLDLLYCIANGFPWLGFPTVKGLVVHFDLELLPADLRRRFELIHQSYAQEGLIGSFDNLKTSSLRGRPFTLQDLADVPKVLAQDVSLFSLDPSYRLLAGKDESDPGVIIDLLNRFLALGTELKSAVGLLQHFSKGDQSNKEAMDRYSGSGVWARHPDALATFTEHEVEDSFGVEFRLRAFAPIDPFTVTWDYPRFRVAPNLDPARLKTRSGRPKLNTTEQLASLLTTSETLPYGDFKRRAEQLLTISKSTFDRRLKEAKDQKLLYLSALNNEYGLTPAYIQKLSQK
jgi:hypothetical protein